MIHHVLAAVGAVAYGIRQVASAILSLVGLRGVARFVVPALTLALAAAAVISARDTLTILASRPEIQRTTLAEVVDSVDEGGSIWFEFDALLDDTSFATPADLGTFFYLARDPDDPTQGLLVRSPLNDAFFRQRVMSATIVEDEDLVAQARDALGALPSGFDLDGTRLLDELAAGGEAAEGLIPSLLSDEATGAEILVTGRIVAPATYAACASEGGCDASGAAWFYYLADPNGGSAMVLRSPHPPTALPATIQGLYQADDFDLRPVIESDWFESIAAQVPTGRALAAGREPPIEIPTSWVPAILFAAIAIVLATSFAIGYPVFGTSPMPAPAQTLAPGAGIDVEISGRLDRQAGPIVLDRSPGAVERITIAEMALRLWRYGLLPGDVSRREAEARFIAEAEGADRLVIHERDRSALVTVTSGLEPSEVRVGRLYRVARSVPSVRVRLGKTDAHLATRTIEERDRVAAEVLGELGG